MALFKNIVSFLSRYLSRQDNLLEEKCTFHYMLSFHSPNAEKIASVINSKQKIAKTK